MDNSVYTVFYTLVSTLRELPIDKPIPLATLYKVAVETVEEYEYGTADIDDLNINDIHQYKNVLENFLFCLRKYIETDVDQNQVTDFHRGHG